MKKLLICLVLFFGFSSVKSATLYDTLNDPPVFYVASIGFPILQQFYVGQDSSIDHITVGVPGKSTPGRELSVLLLNEHRDILQAYEVPSDYYYNVNHYYTFDANNYNLSAGNYYFGVSVSHGPTEWIKTKNGMLGRIDGYCIPEPSTFILAVSSCCIFFLWRFFRV